MIVQCFSNPVLFPVVCERGCGKRFKCKKSMVNHCSTKCKVLLACASCPKSFQSKKMYQDHIKLCTGEDSLRGQGDRLLLSVDDEISKAFADQELPVFVEVRSPHGGPLYISQAAGPSGDSTLLPLVGGVASLPPGDVDDQSHISDLDLSNDSFMDL